MIYERPAPQPAADLGGDRPRVCCAIDHYGFSRARHLLELWVAPDCAGLCVSIAACGVKFGGISTSLAHPRQGDRIFGAKTVCFPYIARTYAGHGFLPFVGTFSPCWAKSAHYKLG